MVNGSQHCHKAVVVMFYKRGQEKSPQLSPANAYITITFASNLREGGKTQCANVLKVLSNQEAFKAHACATVHFNTRHHYSIVSHRNLHLNQTILPRQQPRHSFSTREGNLKSPNKQKCKKVWLAGAESLMTQGNLRALFTLH